MNLTDGEKGFLTLAVIAVCLCLILLAISIADATKWGIACTKAGGYRVTVNDTYACATITLIPATP